MSADRGTARAGLPSAARLAVLLLVAGVGSVVGPSGAAAQAAGGKNQPVSGCASAPPRSAVAQTAGGVPAATSQPVLTEAQPPRLVIAAGFVLGVLNLPKLAMGPALLAEVEAGWPHDFGVSYLPPNGAQVGYRELDLELHPLATVPFPPGGSEIEVSLLQVNAATCPLRHRLTTGRLLGCAGLYGGMLSATGEGFIRGGGEETRFLAGAEVYGRWHFRIAGPVGLTYSAGLFVPFVREPFGYRDREGGFRELFRQPSFGGRLDVMLALWLE
jgi:hypothetical protein